MRVAGKAKILTPIHITRTGGLVFTIRANGEHHMAQAHDATIYDKVQAAALTGQTVEINGELHSFRRKNDRTNTAYVLITNLD